MSTGQEIGHAVHRTANEAEIAHAGRRLQTLAEALGGGVGRLEAALERFELAGKQAMASLKTGGLICGHDEEELGRERRALAGEIARLQHLLQLARRPLLEHEAGEDCAGFQEPEEDGTDSTFCWVCRLRDETDPTGPIPETFAPAPDGVHEAHFTEAAEEPAP